MAGRAGPLTRGRLQLAAYLFLVAIVAFSFWVNHLQDIERCRARNESTEASVQIVVDGLLTAAADADPQRVAAFRDDINRRLTAARVECT